MMTENQILDYVREHPDQRVKVALVDIDGVLTDGTKVYNEKHEVISKRFLCKDFTAIKRMVASGIKVIMLSGDNFNRTMEL
jgi:3-deoxy-D-manno-octulosonate 8-phosphate phosphatase KdsC-like HAD superfamily phosphatase